MLQTLTRPIVSVVFCLCFTSVNCFAALNVPANVQKATYKTQVLYLDSVLNQGANADDAVRKTRIESMKSTSTEHDFRLLLDLRLQLYRFKMTDFAVRSVPESWFTVRAEKANDFLKAELYQTLANMYWEMKNQVKALEYYFIAFGVYQNLKAAEFPYMAEYIYDYGGKFYYFRDFNTAKNIFLNAFRNVPESEISNKISKTNTIALCYNYLGNPDSATWYYLKAMDLARKEKDTLWIGIIDGNLGVLYFDQKQYEKAWDLIYRNLEISLAKNQAMDAAFAYSKLGEICLVRKENKQALEYLTKSRDIIVSRKKQFRFDVVSKVYIPLGRAYLANGMPELAYIYLDSGRMAKDSLDAQRNGLFINGIQRRHEMEAQKAILDSKESQIKIQRLILVAVIFGSLILLAFVLVFFRQKKRISQEKQRSDNLLLNILPEEIAEELKNTGSAQARNFSNVTIMFTDFKDFTASAAHMSAGELVEELDHAFKHFDEIMAKYGIEKIKTIGDSYMCASGLPAEREDHAIVAAKAAQEILDFIETEKQKKIKSGKVYFDIRIGLHSGPVVAGIIGIKKFSFDIWGDTVNTASRMESSGEAGKINISGSTHELIQQQFECTHRGKLPAKGKGEIDMYFINYEAKLTH